jgi:hypothetical protein
MNETKMDLNSIFPSKYIKSSDLQGREVTLTIARIAIEKLDDGQKPVIYFGGKEKGLICNKTNANRIAHYYGTNTDGWIGKQIVLGVELVDMQGQTKEGLRIKGIPAPAPLTQTQPAPAAAAPAANADRPFNDDIPF